MARPPVEWPIPMYVSEFRDRAVAVYRVPGRSLVRLVHAPVVPDLVRGQALVALCLGNGRCLKSVGGNPTLATEFRVAELITPVYWQGACRPILRGSYLLHASTSSHGLSRLLRTSLNFPAGHQELVQGLDRASYHCRSAHHSFALPRVAKEEPWPSGSVFATHEDAEAHLLEPQVYFVPSEGGTVIHAIPVHQYARATTHVHPLEAAAPWLAEFLHARPQEVVLDHIFFQKRCTHTWSFPPERILAARTTPRWATPPTAAWPLPAWRRGCGELASRIYKEAA